MGNSFLFLSFHLIRFRAKTAKPKKVNQPLGLYYGSMFTLSSLQGLSKSLCISWFCKVYTLRNRKIVILEVNISSFPSPLNIHWIRPKFVYLTKIIPFRTLFVFLIVVCSGTAISSSLFLKFGESCWLPLVQSRKDSMHFVPYLRRV